MHDFYEGSNDLISSAFMASWKDSPIDSCVLTKLTVIDQREENVKSGHVKGTTPKASL